jgi:hypothetical protein
MISFSKQRKPDYWICIKWTVQIVLRLCNLANIHWNTRMENAAIYRHLVTKMLTWLMICWVGVTQAYSQALHRRSEWPIGTVFLRSGLELTGTLTYNQKNEMVLLHSDGSIKTFSAHQLRSFQFVQPDLGILRRFGAYPYRRGILGERLRFFEVILAGPFQVLRRDISPQGASRSQLPSTPLALTYDYLTDFTYYVYYQGQFVSMDRFHKIVLPLLMKKYPQELSTLMKDRHWLTLADQIRLINEYNFLESRQQPLPATNTEGIPLTKSRFSLDSLAR